MPDTHNLKEESFNLAHGFGGFGIQLAGYKAETAWWKGTTEERCSTYGSQEAGGGAQSTNTPIRVTPAVTHLLRPGPTSQQHIRLKLIDELTH